MFSPLHSLTEHLSLPGVCTELCPLPSDYKPCGAGAGEDRQETERFYLGVTSAGLRA